MSVVMPRPTDRGIGGDHSFAHLPTAFTCHGCGFRSAAAAPVPMRCPVAAPRDDIDHVLHRTIDTTRIAFPTGSETNPFVRYRSLFHAYHVARAIGWTDGLYRDLVERLDRGIAAIDGHGFVATPLIAADRLAAALGMTGGLLIKDETANVAGSHKARHLMGTALELEVAEALERSMGVAAPQAVSAVVPARLAIASCGNAALAAAVVARAWGRALLVFVPTWADPAVVRRLRELGAEVTVARRDRNVPGDPTYRLLRRAIEDGAVPFTCQGSENGLAIEGGLTLGYELATDLRASGQRLDRLFIQVGGGALASSCSQALDDARALGVLDRLPRIHAVQSAGAWPLVRAYDRVVERLSARLGLEAPAGSGAKTTPGARHAAAERLLAALTGPRTAAELARIARHRSAFMWAWETEPHSVASGILDDVTYDWFAVVGAMLRTGGYPVVASESTLIEADEIGRATTGIAVDPTGTAGLAGLIELRRSGDVAPDETVAVLFTGVRRAAPPDRPPYSAADQGA
jgi:threonine synthase